MKDSDKLFELVQMLTPNERRHVRKFSQKEDTVHIQLFDFMLSEQKYNETRLKKHFESIIRSGKKKAKLTYVKNYLYEFILKALRTYHSDKSETYVIAQYIEDIRFLLNRGNLGYLKKRIEQARKFATENELYTFLLPILGYQRDYYKLTGDSDAAFKTNKEELDCLQKIQQKILYRHISDKVFLLFRKEWHTRKKNLDLKLSEILNKPLIKDPEAPDTFAAKLMRFQIISNIHALNKETNLSFDYQKKMLELFKDSGKSLNDYYFFQYLRVLNNYLSRCLNLQRLDEFTQYFDEFENYKTFEFESQAQVFRCVIYYKLPYFLTKHEFEKASNCIPEITAGLKAYDKFLPPVNKLVMYSNLLSYYLIEEQYEEAQLWIEKIRAFENSNLRLDIQNFARLAQLVICIEIDNFNILLPSFKKSFTRKYKKEERLYEFERIFFRGMESLGKTAKHNSKRDSIFVRLSEDLLVFKTDLSGKVAGIEEIFLWIESRKLKKPIKSLLAASS